MTDIQNYNDDNYSYVSYVGVRFYNATRSYYFGVEEGIDLSPDDEVVVETIRGLELGYVTAGPYPISKYRSELGLRPVLRKATEVDGKIYDQNKKDAVFAMNICRDEIARLNLKMNLISSEYTLDKSKAIFSYVADERVDFRELLKTLASRLHTRIELRQIGPRDKAKMIGGIGLCGLPLCCSTFLNEFDGISITRAKNQMLAINIPKLSGHCGKLICCLKYEDDNYTESRKVMPNMGTRVFIDKKEYTVTGMNLLTQVVKVECQDDTKFLPLKDFIAQTHWKKRPDHDKDFGHDNRPRRDDRAPKVLNDDKKQEL